MEKGLDIIPSNEVSSSHKVCDYLEDEGFIKPGGVTFHLAEYCGLGHLCDELGDCMSDHELAEECNKHCFFVEFDDGDVVYRELHTRNNEAFKSELRHRITQTIAITNSLPRPPTNVAAFPDFVLGHYVETGVESLDRSKLPDYLKLKFGTLGEGQAALGGMDQVVSSYVSFQRHMYTPSN